VEQTELDPRRRRRGLLALAGAGLFGAASLAPRVAEAHTAGLSRGEYVVDGSEVRASITLARGELVTAIPAVDANHDGALDEGEIANARGPVEAALVNRIEVRADGRPCTGKLTGARAVAEDGVELDASYACPGPPREVSVDARFLDEFPSGHRHVARLARGPVDREDVLFRNKEHLALSTVASPDAAPRSTREIAWGFFRQGIEHILTGYDHLSFLVGLVLVRGKLKSVLALVTAFTLAHSVTLALAVLGVWAPSPRFTEPAIALSVAYVGVENFWLRDLSKRWRVTAPFGLVHGFGFAGALGEIALPRPEIPVALATFNLGVEAGQLGVLALLLPLVHLARRRAWFDRVGVRALSAALVALGLVWFVSRIVWPPT
jgi:hydrogenase/urease accessory protein HupE